MGASGLSGPPGPSGAVGQAGAYELVDAAGVSYPLVSLMPNFYAGDAFVLIDGLVFDINLPAGTVQVPATTLYYSDTDCTGSLYMASVGIVQNLAYAAYGAQAQGQPVYVNSGTGGQHTYQSRSDGHGGCLSESGTTSLIPATPAGTTPPALTPPIRLTHV